MRLAASLRLRNGQRKGLQNMSREPLLLRQAHPASLSSLYHARDFGNWNEAVNRHVYELHEARNEQQNCRRAESVRELGLDFQPCRQLEVLVSKQFPARMKQAHLCTLTVYDGHTLVGEVFATCLGVREDRYDP
eukprot:scaffold5222_cov293-Pinguiococcus_pyrenoidosus.AAC.6